MVDTLNIPVLRTDGRLVGLSTATKPTTDEDGSTLEIGSEYVEDDTGASWYWDGSNWQAATLMQKLSQGIELMFEIRDLLQEEDDE